MSRTEATLAIIKPEPVLTCQAMEILSMAERAGLDVVAAKRLVLDRKDAEEFYKEHEGHPFFERLIKHMTKGPVVVAVLTGVRAVERWRGLLGPSDPLEARKRHPGSIRAVYGDELPANAAHGTSDIKAVVREIEFFFPGYYRSEVVGGGLTIF